MSITLSTSSFLRRNVKPLSHKNEFLHTRLHYRLFRTLFDDNFRKNHVYGHNNLSSFLIGISTGYLIYYLQQQRVEYPNFKVGIG